MTWPRVGSAVFVAWAFWKRVPGHDRPVLPGARVVQSWWVALAEYDKWHHWRALGDPRPIRHTSWTKVPSWAWELEKARAALPPPPVPQPVEVPASRWDRFGALLYTAANVQDGIPGLCRWLAEIPPPHGPGWVAFQTHEGANGTGPNVYTPQMADAARAVLGPENVVAWGWVDGANPDGEITAAAETSRPFADYILNAELQWKLTGGVFTRADYFAPRFRQLTDKGTLISTLVGADIHFQPLWEAGFRWVAPQTYDAVDPGNTIQYGVTRAVTSVQADFPGWDARRVKPTIGTYGPGQAAHYVEQMRAYVRGGGRGLSGYSAEHWTAEDRAAILLGLSA